MVFISTEYGGRELLLHNYHPGCISLNKGKRKAKRASLKQPKQDSSSPNTAIKKKNQTLVFEESYCCDLEWRKTELVTAGISLTFHKELCSGRISPGKFCRYSFS